jgi:hypothetical protein
MAAGGCVIRWKGVDHTVTDPQLVGKEVALATAPGRLERTIIRRIDFPAFIQLRRR